MKIYLDDGRKFADASAKAIKLPKADQYQIEAEVFSRAVRGKEKLEFGVEDARPVFIRMRECFEDLLKEGVGADHGQFNILSMGMTNDFEVAIAEGANIVRIGTAIFGERTGPADDDDEPRESDED